MDIKQWGNTNWTSFQNAFHGAENLNISATDAPNLSNVTDMFNMFRGASSFNGVIGHWDVSNIRNMQGTFYGATLFNQNLNSWNTSNVNNLYSTFAYASSFNQPLNNWNVSNVTTMQSMFYAANSFNQPLNNWNTGNVSSLRSTFYKAYNFNGDISNWNTSNVLSMYLTFGRATSFNQDLSDWNFESVSDFTSFMNYSGISVNNYDNLLNTLAAQGVVPHMTFGGIGRKYCEASDSRDFLISEKSWNIQDSGEQCIDIFQDAFITMWDTEKVSAGSSNNLSISIPTVGSGYNYSVDWGDGVIEHGITGTTSHTYLETGVYEVKIVGDFPRIYFNNTGDRNKILDIKQWGNINWQNMEYSFYGAENLNISAKDAPNLSNVTSMLAMFQSATSFNSNINNWNVSNIINMQHMFTLASSFNQPLNNWNVSNVTNMFGMFSYTDDFNQPLNSWNTGNVTNMQGMFYLAKVFNQDLSNWNISAVINAAGMLSNSGINQTNYDNILNSWGAKTVNTGVNLGANGLRYCDGEAGRNSLISKGWTITDGGKLCEEDYFIFEIDTRNISDGSSLENQFRIPTMGSGYNYSVDWGNGDIQTGITGTETKTYENPGIYEIKIVGDFPRIYFNDTGDKNKILDIKQWGNIEWITSLENAFYGSENINISAIDAPNLSKVISLQNMFRDTLVFNSNINNWDVSNVNSMHGMFYGAKAFNQPLNNWNTEKVEIMTAMFMGAIEFDQSLNNWNVQNVTSMQSMFSGAIKFNQPLNNWNTSSVISFSSLFNGTKVFNQSLDNWNTSKVENMQSVFYEAEGFNQSLDNWNTSNVTNMQSMLYGATSFNQDLSNWNISAVTNAAGMLSNSGINQTNYDNILNSWGAKTVNTGVNLGANGLRYCDGEPGRNSLISKGWTITDGGKTCEEDYFVIEIDTRNLSDGSSLENQFRIPTMGSGYNYSVDWGNGDIQTGITGTETKTYENPGIYEIKIVGDFPRIYFNDTGIKIKFWILNNGEI